MAVNGNKASVNLLSSICVDEIDQNVSKYQHHQFGDAAANHLISTGIEREGGLTNIYEQETNYGDTGSYFLSEDGKTISLVQTGDSVSPVKLDGKTIGSVSAYGIEKRIQISGVDDAILTADTTYLTAKINGATITVNEYSISSQTLLNTRTTTFGVLQSVTSAYSSLNFVRWNNMHFNQQLEFLLRVGSQIYILREASPNFIGYKFSSLTDAKWGSITTQGVFTTTGDSWMVFGTSYGCIFSLDRVGNYRWPDGTGVGTGPFAYKNIVGDTIIRAIRQASSYLAIAGGSKIGSFDSNLAIKGYDVSGNLYGFGTGPYVSSTASNGYTIYNLATYTVPAGDSVFLVVCAGNGNLSNYLVNSNKSVSYWTYYNGTTSTGQPARQPYNASSVITTNQIFAAAQYKNMLFVAGSSGLVGSYSGDSGAWQNYNKSGVGPFSNATVLGARSITGISSYNVIGDTRYVVFSGDSGRIGNYYGSSTSGTWRNYNAVLTGKGPADTGYIVGYNVGPNMYTSGDSTLLFLATGRLASYDGKQWKRFDNTGTGTGIYIDAKQNLSMGVASSITSWNNKLVMSCQDVNWSNLPAYAIFVYNVSYSSFETVYNKTNIPLTYFGYFTPQSTVTAKYNDGIVYSIGNSLNYFDGVNWSLTSGVGIVSPGPLNTGGALGGQNITASCSIKKNNENFFVIGGSGGRIASWGDTSGWRYYDGTVGGYGPYNDGTVVANTSIVKLVPIGTKIAVVSANFVGSWDGSNWKNWNGTGTGTGPYLSGNRGSGSVIGFTNYQTQDACAYGTSLVLVAHATYRVQINFSYWNQAWSYSGVSRTYGTLVSSIDSSNNVKYWDGAGSGTGPYGSYTSNEYVGNDLSYAEGFWPVEDPIGEIYDASARCAVIGSKLYIGGTAYFRFKVYARAISQPEINFDYNYHVNTLYTWDGSNWKFPLAEGTGTGQYGFWFWVWNNTYSVVANQFSSGSVSLPTASVAPYYVSNFSSWNGHLIISYSYLYGSATTINSFDGSNWKYQNGTGTGTGPYNPSNNNLLGSNPITTIADWNPSATHYMMIGSKFTNGVASWDGSNWKYQNGTGTGTGPYNSGAVLGNDATTAVVSVGNYLAVGSNVSKVANYSVAAGWILYSQYYSNNFTSSGLAALFPIGIAIIGAIIQYNTFLVVAGASGRVSSWDGTAWKYYDGTGTGSGPYNAGTATNNNTIYTMCKFQNYLVVAGGGGLVASFNGAWNNYNSAVNISSNAGLVSTQIIYVSYVYTGATSGTTYIVFGAAAGLVGNVSITTGGTIAYNAYTSGTAFVSNAAIVGGAVVSAFTQYDKYLVIASNTGFIGCWDNGGTAYLYNNTTNNVPVGNQPASSDAIGNLISFNGYLIGITTTGAVFSWDNTVKAWRTPINKVVYLNSVSTLYNPQGPYQIFNGGSSSFNYIVYQNQIYVFTYQQVMIFVSKVIATHLIQSFNGSTLNITSTRNASISAWKFENGNYIFGITGNDGNILYEWDGVTSITLIPGKYIIPQIKNNYSRVMITGDATFTVGVMNAVGFLGHNSFTSTFTGVPYYESQGIQVASITSQQSGAGYYDATIKKVGDTTIYSYYSPFYNNQQYLSFGVQGSGTNALLNAYGKITNNYQDTSDTPFEFRNCYINGVSSYLSIALKSSTLDNLGVLLTNVGDYSSDFTPHIAFDNTILFSNGLNLYIIKISKNTENPIQQIAERIYKLNTIHPFNIIDTQVETLELGSIDFNGRALWSYIGSPAVSSTRFASMIQGKYCNSIDVGDKFTLIPSITTDNYEILGYRVPNLKSINKNYEVDVFINDAYYSSTQSDGSEITDNNKAGTLYSNTLINPVAIDYTYFNKTLKTLNSTIVLISDYNTGPVYGIVPFYDGFPVSNEIGGSYIPFYLAGQYYLFDGDFIYRVGIQNNTLVSRDRIAFANGLQYIATAPNVIHFLSSFDNSMFTFDGGIFLNKGKRFNKIDAITDGVYNVRDNSLLLQTATQFIWVRDGVITTNLKKINQTNTKLYSTINGIQISNNNRKWIYSYQQLSGSSVIPLSWQSAYFGLSDNEKSIVSSIVCAIHSPSNSSMNLTATFDTIDESEETSQSIQFEIKPSDWSKNGIYHLRVQPKQQRALGNSFGLYSAGKITLLDCIMEYAPDVHGVPSPSRSK